MQSLQTSTAAPCQFLGEIILDNDNAAAPNIVAICNAFSHARDAGMLVKNISAKATSGAVSFPAGQAEVDKETKER